MSLNPLTEITCRIRVKDFVVGAVSDLAHGFVDVLLTVHDYHLRALIRWFDNDILA